MFILYRTLPLLSECVVPPIWHALLCYSDSLHRCKPDYRHNAKPTVCKRSRRQHLFRAHRVSRQRLPPPAIIQLQSELQLQQIELRLQNEEICRLQSKLHASQNQDVAKQFGNLIDSVGGILWTADFGTLTMGFINKQAERTLGYPVSDWLNQENFWQDHIHPRMGIGRVNALARLPRRRHRKKARRICVCNEDKAARDYW